MVTVSRSGNTSGSNISIFLPSANEVAERLCFYTLSVSQSVHLHLPQCMPGIHPPTQYMLGYTTHPSMHWAGEGVSQHVLGRGMCIPA